MALIVETGAVVAGADSYVTIAEADAFHSSRGNAGWIGTDPEKEIALRRAMDYLQSTYHGGWLGTRVSDLQEWDWPRQLVPLDDRRYMVSYRSMTVIPPEVKRAQMLLALPALTADLMPSKERAVKRESVGEIAVEYDDASPEGTRYIAVDAVLAPLLEAGGSGIMVKLER